MESHFKNEPSFKNVHVKGEVSNKFISQNNHLYFTLKDKHSQVQCIVYSWFRNNIQFDIENGMKLLVTANIIVYPPHGKYQLDIISAVEDGLGQLFVKYRQLKKKLTKEGLFKEEHKKDLPHFPKKIGVITSKGGSVIHDIIKTVEKQWPYCEVLLFPAAVQGQNSKRELVTQIKRADGFGLDVLIIARGGGSLEELWSYNEEIVVRSIFECNTPVISAIGHEDHTPLCDLVADVRASTPTMAASLAVQDKNAILNNINHYNSRLISFISSKLDDYKQQLEFISSKTAFVDKTYVYKSQKDDFDSLCNRFDSSSKELLTSNRVRLNKITSEYVIRHPCKMQFDDSKADLNDEKTRLFEAMNKLLKKQELNLDKATDKFNFLSDKLVASKRNELEISKYYFKKNPCQDMIVMSRNDLSMAEDKLISQTNFSIENNRKKLILICNNFKNSSKNLINSKRALLNKISSQYVIKHPCKIQIDELNSNLNEYQERLENSSNLILTDNNIKLDNNVNRLKFLSEKLVLSKRHDFEIIKSNFSINICQNKINSSKSGLNLAEDKLIAQTNANIENNKRKLDLIKTNFKNNSNEIILKNSHKLDSIKSSGSIRNPKRTYYSKLGELQQVKNEKIIKTPYLILDSYKSELNIYNDKLEKIKQVIELKKEQEKQKQRYLIIIVAIVIVMIIILFIMFGGIL